MSASISWSLDITYLTVRWLGAVHFVDPHDELLYTERVGQQGMLSGLPILGDASFKLASACCYNQHPTVSLLQHIMNMQRIEKIHKKEREKKVTY